jgi:CubicO group peptidase (beta-lactamase class C family)
VYDLASLTKIVSTLPLMLLTVSAGRLALDDSADSLLPEMKAGTGRSWNHAITVRNLLSHSSGLPAWRPYFVRLHRKEDYLSAIAGETPAYPPNTAVEYSDLGFMLLGWILERAWEEDLPALAAQRLFKPLGMETTGYRPGSDPRFKGRDFAPTEKGNAFERGMALAYAERRPVIGGYGTTYPLEPVELGSLAWRTGVIEGEVHDANCHYGLGGVSGHAGLFSTVGDLLRWCSFWDEGGMLDPGIRAEAFKRQTPSASVARGLGWLLDDDGTAHHTGFTGTSIRYSPRIGTALVALTNRVHPTVRDSIGPWRLRLADAMDGCMRNG